MRPKNTPQYTAFTVSLCVPSGEGAAITTPTAGSCGSGTSVQLPSQPEEQKKLISILPHINYIASGVDKQPTIQFSGINLQVINGSGSQSTLNGTGNLILGYDPGPGTQTGSHNLLLGGNGNSYSSYGGIVDGGYGNKITGPYDSILGGAENTATASSSTIVGGYANKTTTNYATINGGCSNLAGTGAPTVNAACTAVHAGYFTSILGGAGNQAEAENSSVSGGAFSLADDLYTSISGGCDNPAAAGGSRLGLPSGVSCASGIGAQYASISGGGGGEASAPDASVTGGRLGKAHYFASTVLDGLEEEAEADYGVTP
jgi:hypothetical protein